MSDNDSLESKKKIEPIMIIIPIVAVIVIGVAVGGYYLNNYIKGLKSQYTESGVVTDPNVFFNDEDAEEYLADRVPAINIIMLQSMTCYRDEDGNMFAKVGLNNQNEHQYMVEFTMELTGELIHRTGLIPPGGKLDVIPIDMDLKPGTYSVNAIFTAVSEEDNKTDLGSAGINVDMYVS